MPSPGTSAQGAPRTTDYCAVCGESPESATHEGMPGGHAWTRRAPVASQEAEAREEALDGLRFAPTREIRGEHLDAYAAAIRASERERYAALVDAATDALVYFDLKPHGAALKKERLRAALAALEEAGSA